MSDLNKVILVGRMTKDAELRQTPNGANVATFSLAVNRTYKSDGDKKESVSFISCVAWSKTAETIAQYCKKGQRIGIEGRLQQRTWEDDKGQKRSVVEVIVENFQFLESAKKDGVESKGIPDCSPDNPFDDQDLPF